MDEQPINTVTDSISPDRPADYQSEVVVRPPEQSKPTDQHREADSTQTPKRSFPIGFVPGIIGLLLIGLVLGFLMRQASLAPSPSTTQPTQAAGFPSPTPQRELSQIATVSAFLKLESSIASLSSHINAYAPQDGTLSPPVLELPLGFSNR